MFKVSPLVSKYAASYQYVSQYLCVLFCVLNTITQFIPKILQATSEFIINGFNFIRQFISNSIWYY